MVGDAVGRDRAEEGSDREGGSHGIGSHQHLFSHSLHLRVFSICKIKLLQGWQQFS